MSDPAALPRMRDVLRSGLIVLIALAVPVSHAAAQASVLDRWDFAAGPSGTAKLDRSLREISGLAVGPRGRLFAHDDERAEVYELNPRTGERVARFGPGRSPLDGDFEGLAWADGGFFLITSEGTIVEFPGGTDGERTEYRRHVTGLGRTCEVEGLTHDARAHVLLVACKRMYGEGPPGIYAFDLARRQLDPRPRWAVRSLTGEPVSPSGIVVEPTSGHLLILAAQQRRILEMDRTGRTVAEHRLRAETHAQPEGIELLPDGTLVIGDEGGDGRARLSWYRPATTR